MFDALPAQEIIDNARDAVERGLADIPSFRGAGYRVTRDQTYTGFILLSNRTVEVTFNLLDPVAVLKGIGDELAAALTKR